MTICIDIRNLAQKNHSGVGKYTANLLENLFKFDTTNEYKLFYNSKKFHLIKKYYKNVTYYDFHKSNRLLNLTMFLFNFPKIDKLVGGCDVFFAPNINFFAFSKDKKIKKIITIHDISFLHFKDFYSKKSILWHKIINIKKIIKKFDHIITVSENTKQDIIKYFNIPEDKVTAINLGGNNSEQVSKLASRCQINLALTGSQLKQVREDILNIKNPYLLNINTIEPRKNIEGIINAFIELKEEQKIDNIDLIIAGGRGWNSSGIFKMLENNKYKNNIKIFDYISEEEKDYLYKHAKIFIFPSFYEGFGIPIIEAQNNGVPIISSSNSSLTEIVGTSGLLINPNNINEIKFAIEQLVNDGVLYNRYKELSIENAKRFTWERCAMKTLLTIRA